MRHPLLALGLAVAFGTGCAVDVSLAGNGSTPADTTRGSSSTRSTAPRGHVWVFDDADGTAPPWATRGTFPEARAGQRGVAVSPGLSSE